MIRRVFRAGFALILSLLMVLFLSSMNVIAQENSEVSIVNCKNSKQIKELCLKGEYEKVRQMIQDALDSIVENGSSSKSDLLMDLAGCYFNLGQYDLAQKTVEKSLNIEATSADRYCPANKIFNLAECLYFQRKYDQAIAKYLVAVDMIKNYKEPKLKRRLYMSLASCYSIRGNFKEARKYQEEAVRLDKQIFGNIDLNYGWGLYKLSDIYRKLGDPRSQVILEKAIWIFRIQNRDRILKEFAVNGKNLTGAKKFLANRIDKSLFGMEKSHSYENADSFLFSNKNNLKVDQKSVRKNCSIWKNQYEATDAPGLAWMDPTKPVKAIVLAVHGLGLHHGAYESFGRRIAKEGVMTISFDVRGFGSYLESKGSELVNMNQCVEDLKAIFDVIHKDSPDTPIFLLGESMGGAIVMRFGALYPKGLSGIICSVPSGSRYEPAITKMKIGLSYLKDKNNQVDIAPYVVSQATSDAKLRKRWKLDTSSRLRLSPKELLDFRRFMNENTTYAKKITKLPVLIFQGDEDGLVKSKGTYDLFEAVRSKDKTLVVVGGTEHLIFEAGSLEMVSHWVLLDG